MAESADKDVLKSAVEFWQQLYTDGEGTVKFVKNDGTIRIMHCTLDFNKIPKKDHPKKVNVPEILRLIQEKGIMHVYDLDKKGWRSVPFSKVDWLETPTKRFKIRPFTK